MSHRFSSWLDRSAITLSGLCLVHCLVGSLLLTAASLSAGLLSHNVHAIGLAIALPLAAFALWRGVTLHGRFGVAVLGASGIALMAVSLLVGHGAPSEVLLSVCGVGLLAGAHWWNLRASRA